MAVTTELCHGSCAAMAVVRGICTRGLKTPEIHKLKEKKKEIK